MAASNLQLPFFSKGELEEYQSWLFTNTRELSILTLSIGMAIFIFFVLIDTTVLGELHPLSFTFRVVFGIPTLLIGRKILKSLSSINHFKYFTFSLVFLAQSMHLIMDAYIGFDLKYLVILEIVLLFTIVLTPMLSTKNVAFLCAFLFFSFFIHVYYFQPARTQQEAILPIVGALFIICTLSTMGGALLNYFKRMNFLNVNQLVQEKLNLAMKTLHVSKVNQLMAHDLKTPVRNISSFTALLSLKKDQFDEESLNYFNFVIKNAKKLNDLVDDFLVYSELQDTKLQTEHKINLNQLVTELEENYKKEFKKSSISFNVSNDLPTISANENYLKILFKNIFDNAIRYNKSKEIIIDIETTIDQEFHMIKIKDNGIGIDKNYHGKIFEMFEKLNPENDYGGSGMGLASCKSIMTKLSGKIELQDSSKEGSVFCLYFPKQIVA